MHCGGISDNILKGIDCEDFYITLKPTVTALFFCKGKNSVISRPIEVWFLSFLVAFVSICERQQQLIFCSLSFPSSTSTLPRALHNEGDRPKRGGRHSGRCFQLFSFSINNCICWKGGWARCGDCSSESSSLAVIMQRKTLGHPADKNIYHENFGTNLIIQVLCPFTI